MKGFRAFRFAFATVEGIEVAHMIRKDQLASGKNSPLSAIRGLGSIIVAENRDVCGVIKICDKTRVGSYRCPVFFRKLGPCRDGLAYIQKTIDEAGCEPHIT